METSFQKIYRFVVACLASFFLVSISHAALPKIDENYQFYNHEYFSFEFQNDHSVKKFEDIWYVQHNTSKTTSFILFEKPFKVFDSEGFDCGRFFDQTEYCVYRPEKNTVVKNFMIKNRAQAFAPFSSVGTQAFDFFQTQSVQFDAPKDFKMVTRLEALRFILRWNNPGKKYNKYADACFKDVLKESLFSGEICYAKQKGIIQGIDGKFYPELGINIWGVLQLLHRNFQIPVEKFSDWSLVEDSVLSGIHKNHLGFDIVANAYKNGILRAENNYALWPNQVLNQSEFVDILYRFWRWKNGVKLKQFNSTSYGSVPALVRENRLISYRLKPYKAHKKPSLKGFEPLRVTWKNTKQGRLLLYEKVTDTVDQYLASIPMPDLVQTVEVWWKPLKFTGVVRVKTTTKNLWYKISPSKSMVKQIPTQKSTDAWQYLNRRSYLPNQVLPLKNIDIPVVKLFLSPSQWQEMIEKRTTRQPYIAWMELRLPDGSTAKRVVRLKTRGNGSLGYVKPSFTVELFKAFSKKMPIDFLADGDEFKLRSVFGDQTMIREKLWYKAFAALGWPAPEFETVLVELNNQPFGVYQMVEPIKSSFFSRRNLVVDDYFYAKNSGSKYNPNLLMLGSENETLDQYKIKGNRSVFVRFLQQINSTSDGGIKNINTKAVLDYAWLTYLADGWDSVSRNFYVYFDTKKQHWSLFPWDGDETFGRKKDLISPQDFTYYLRDTTGNFNQLFLYVSHFVSSETLQKRGQKVYDFLQSDWVKQQILAYQKKLGPYFEYDNRLWNGKALERRTNIINTKQSLEALLNVWK